MSATEQVRGTVGRESSSLLAPRPTPAPRRRRTGHGRALRLGLGWAVVVVLLGVWELVGRADTTGLLPPFSTVAAEAFAILTDERLVDDVVPSLLRALAGFLVGSALAIAVGVALGWFRALAPWTNPALELLRAVPVPALVPIAVAAFGSTTSMKVGVIALGAFWPVLLNTVDGVRRVEPGYVEAARVYSGGTTRALLWRTALPAALPQIMTGLRIGLAISLVVMVISEMFGSSDGLGYLILQSQRLYALVPMYAGVLLLGLLGVLLTAAFSRVERRSIRWFEGQKGRSDG